MYGMLELVQGDCGTVVPPVVPNLVVTNPPWGGRISGGAGGEWEGEGEAEGEGGEQGGEGEAEDWAAGGDGGWDRGAGRSRSRDASPVLGDSPELERAWRSLDGFLYRSCPGGCRWRVEVWCCGLGHIEE